MYSNQKCLHVGLVLNQIYGLHMYTIYVVMTYKNDIK